MGKITGNRELTDEEIKDLCKDQFFLWSIVVQKADTSDWNEEEIRTISCNVSGKDLLLGKWNNKIPLKEPMEMDSGINKYKERFTYRDSNWIKISTKIKNPLTVQDCIPPGPLNKK